MDERGERLNGCVGDWIGGLMDGCMRGKEELMNELMDRWVDGGGRD